MSSLSVSAPFVKARRDIPPHFHDASLRLAGMGYVAGPPPWATTDTIEIDRETAEQSVCDCCGAEGMTYLPYHRDESGARSYVALAVCSTCRRAVEF